MKALLVTVAGIVLALLASLFDLTWLVAISSLAALAGAWTQYKDSLPFELVFVDTDWEKAGAEFQLLVPKSKHGKVSPAWTTLRGTPPVFEEIVCGASVDAQGCVILSASMKFSGKVVIR